MTDMDNKDDNRGGKEYAIGYKKPPRQTRFQKGQSGNPKGRPKGTRNFTTDVRATLKKPLRINKNGRSETVSTQRGILLRLIDRALKGDARALDRALVLAASHNNDEADEETDQSPSPMDERILKNYLQRHFAGDESDPHLIDCVENEPETIAEPSDTTILDEQASD